ncbi:MAG: 4-hydroxythreonine-4-phosphate dehydrogenase PdxA, partial [Planctomycetota bacterium]
MGDPAGIGPELCLRLIDTPLDRGVRLVIVGSGSVLRAVAERLGIADAMAAIPIVGSADPASVTAAWSTSGTVPLIVDLGPDAERVRAGAVDAETGRASFEYVERAIELALGGVVDAVVTGPIHKEAWHAAGVPYPGHTELFSERTGAQRTCMMLTSEAITCSLVTTHIGLADVARAIDSERIRTVIELTGHAMQRLRGRPPRLGVCGLNPHAGEHGLFGYGEEERVIEPALAAARTAGWNVEGPLSADTAFTPDQRRRFDAYV